MARRTRPRRPAAVLDEAPAPRGRRSETLSRIAWALPWIVFAIAIIVIGGLPFALAMIGFAAIGLNELYRMTSRARPLAPVGYATAAAFAIAAYYGGQFQLMIALVVSFPLVFFAAASRPDRRHIAYSIAVTVLGIVWVGLPFAHAVLLRELPVHGGALLVDVLVATFLADTAAYASGRLFGRYPLAPTLSPGKTIEGLIGGFLGGTLGFWFAGLYQDWLPGLDALAMGACIGAIAPIGDLFESLIKRDLGVKDTGNVFGPHGGLLDRLDAALFTIVAGYYLALAFVY